MRAGGGLHFIDGPQGHGKSFLAARIIGDSLISGRHVVSNITLRPGWEKLVARHNPRNFGRRPKDSYADLADRYHFTTDVNEAMKFQLLCHLCGREPFDCGHEQPEALAVFVWDEAHNDLNNRDWSGRGGTREAVEEDKQRRQRIILWATQLRKLGYEAYFVTQHWNNVDVGLRRVSGWRIRMRNQQKAVRPLGLQLLPFPFFVASYFHADMETNIFSKPEMVGRYFLTWHKKLYQTRAVFHGLDTYLAGEQAIWLDPRPFRKRRRGAGGAQPPAPDGATPIGDVA